MKTAKLRRGDRVDVRALHVNGGVACSGRITAVDDPGRRFGVRLAGGRCVTLFDDELEVARNPAR